MSKINIVALRQYLIDYYGTAAFSGFPAAIVDEFEIESMTPEALCRFAIQHDVDLSYFEESE